MGKVYVSKPIDFGEMTPDEIEKWEKKTNSLVCFGCDKSIAFQKTKGEDATLVVFVKNRRPIVFDWHESRRLRDYLNDNFPIF